MSGFDSHGMLDCRGIILSHRLLLVVGLVCKREWLGHFFASSTVYKGNFRIESFEFFFRELLLNSIFISLLEIDRLVVNRDRHVLRLISARHGNPLGRLRYHRPNCLRLSNTNQGCATSSTC